jgi:ADP-heptose:LPS heptosyltransferase
VALSSTRPELLVLRALGLGDLLTVLPALRGLRAAFPGHRLTVAAPGSLEALARHAGVADAWVPTDGLHRVPAVTGPPRRPAVAVNLHGRGPQSHSWLAAHEPAHMIAFAAPPRYLDGPRWEGAGPHEVARWCRLLAAHGIASDGGHLFLARPPVDPAWSGAVLVHPGAASPARRWPAARFAEVASALAGDGQRVVVTAGPGEEAAAGAVAAAAAVELAHGMDLLELVALVADAPLLVSGDTGLGHVATATGTPSVLLFGPSPPSSWGPPPGSSRHRVLWGGTTGEPLAGEVDPGLARITVAEVLDAARTQLGRRYPRRGTPVADGGPHRRRNC